jgi:hypothetical protein
MLPSDGDIENAFWADVDRWPAEPLVNTEPARESSTRRRDDDRGLVSDSENRLASPAVLVEFRVQPTHLVETGTAPKGLETNDVEPDESESASHFSVRDAVISLALTLLVVVGPALVVMWAQSELDQLRTAQAAASGSFLD